jgi:hypothetical protein
VLIRQDKALPVEARRNKGGKTGAELANLLSNKECAMKKAVVFDGCNVAKWGIGRIYRYTWQISFIPPLIDCPILPLSSTIKP